ncbi:MAG: DUF5665 domain-containing protein [Desulfovibrio sp.]|jgi:hypothetical protein|nr:DUF5665 domain-containing protein [Desulfovibrio sp.]
MPEADNDPSAQQSKHLKQLAKYLDSSGIAEYVQLTRKPGKLLWLNFIAGIARGLGFTIGTTLVLAVVYKILSRVISMNIPYITEMLRELIDLSKVGG